MSKSTPQTLHVRACDAKFCHGFFWGDVLTLPHNSISKSPLLPKPLPKLYTWVKNTKQAFRVAHLRRLPSTTPLPLVNSKDSACSVRSARQVPQSMSYRPLGHDTTKAPAFLQISGSFNDTNAPARPSGSVLVSISTPYFHPPCRVLHPCTLDRYASVCSTHAHRHRRRRRRQRPHRAFRSLCTPMVQSRVYGRARAYTTRPLPP